MVAWVIRFVHNCQVGTEKDRMKGTFVPEDLEAAEELILKDVQREAFDKETRILRAGETLPTTNKLASLSPFIGADEIIRVGGRLKNAKVPYQSKHCYPAWYSSRDKDAH